MARSNAQYSIVRFCPIQEKIFFGLILLMLYICTLTYLSMWMDIFLKISLLIWRLMKAIFIFDIFLECFLLGAILLTLYLPHDCLFFQITLHIWRTMWASLIFDFFCKLFSFGGVRFLVEDYYILKLNGLICIQL